MTRYKDRVSKWQIKNMPTNATTNKRAKYLANIHTLSDEEHEINLLINKKDLVEKQTVIYEKEKRNQRDLYFPISILV